MRDALAAFLRYERPELVQLDVARARARREHGFEAAAETAGAEQACDDSTHRPREDALDRSDALRLGEHAAVEQRDAGDAGRARGFVLLAREQLLRDGVAVVVREHVALEQTELAPERRHDVGLLGDRVMVVGGLVGEAVAQQIQREQAEARLELGPQAMPIPRRGGEAVDQREGGAGRVGPVARLVHEHAMTGQLVLLAACTPVRQARREARGVARRVVALAHGGEPSRERRRLARPRPSRTIIACV